MEQKLYIVRHAHADVADCDDIRPLSAKGLRQMKRLGAAFKGGGHIRPEVIWHSGLLRALQTAESLKGDLELEAQLCEKRGLAPCDDPRGIACQIGGASKSLMIVGHEPNLSALASILLADRDDFERVIFPKASILCLSRMKVARQSTPWQIEWHVNPKLFA